MCVRDAHCVYSPGPPIKTYLRRCSEQQCSQLIACRCFVGTTFISSLSHTVIMNLLCRKQETNDRTVEEDDDDDAVDPSQDMSTVGVRKLKPWMRFTKLFVLCLIWIMFTVKTDTDLAGRVFYINSRQLFVLLGK